MADSSLVPLPSPSPAPGKPAPTVQGSLCTVPDAERPASGNTDDCLVAVDPAPSNATLLWLPGLNSRTCRVQLTTVSRRDAARLARDLLAAPAVSSAATTCPMDDGTAVTAYFRYADRTQSEVVGVQLTGCSSIVAPDRRARTMTADVAHDLRRAAPADWLQYFDTK